MNHPTNLTYRATPDANSYTLLDADTGRWFISLLNNGEQTTAQQEANMQRLAACWNACNGVSTQELTDMMFSLPNAYVKMRVERDELSTALGTSASNHTTMATKLAQAESQRDALLVQLKEAVRLYETRSLIAAVTGCGKWVNDSRDAIASCQRPAITPTITTTCPGNRPECKWVDTLPFGSKCTTCGYTCPF